MRAPDFWQYRSAAARLLAPLGALYGVSVAFKVKRAQPYTADIPVICVGNLTAGGSGKTPIALALAQALQQRDRNVFFLTRGYGGREHGPLRVTPPHNAEAIGDEALLLAATAPTIVARNRAAGTRLAQAEGADILVMDDGHQNFSLRKNLSLVVVDAQSGFGNGLMIPAGPLREPVAQGLSRADAVILVGDGAPDLQGFNKSVLRAHLSVDGTTFSGKPVFAFAGIGRPEKFIASLRDSGAVVAGRKFFADHHAYSENEISRLRAMAQDAILVTTQKDYVRLTPSQRANIHVLPANAVFDDNAALTRLLDSLPPKA
jgi:tetraacyldisaccharide 4'-kinase